MNHKKVVKITDNESLIQEQGKLFKLHHFGRGHNLFYNEINGEEYDKRIQALAEKIAGFPQVNLLDVLKDALYDMTIQHLERLEKRLESEVETARMEGREPKIKTKTVQRGTCVTLEINDRFATTIRV